MTTQFRTLVRATFGSFFESELLASGLPQVRLVIFAAVVLMIPATQLPMHAWYEYLVASRRTPELLDVLMWPHKLLFVTFAMVGTAVVALIIWDNVFPDRRDVFIIGHLPIRPRTILGARLVAVMALMGLIALGAALPSALFYGTVAGGYSRAGILRTIVAHFIATMGASMFAFLLLLCLQGILINVVPGRWLQRAVVLLQFVFVVASLEALLFMFPVAEALRRAIASNAAVNSGWMTWMPPAWFLGLYELLAGTARPIRYLGISAAASIACLLPFAFGLYVFTYARLTRRAVEGRDTGRTGLMARREPLLATVAATLTRSVIGQGVARFAVVTIVRSRKHRLLLTIFAGVGTTAAAMGVLVPLSRQAALAAAFSPQTVLPVGLVLVFFLVVGERTLFAIPAEPAANWAFKLSDAEDQRLHLRGAAAAMLGIGVIPVVVLLAPVHFLVLGAATTVYHSAVLFAAGFLLSEVVLKNFFRVPFTSAFNAPAARARLMWPFWLIGFSLFSFTLASVEGGLLRARPFAAVLLPAGIVLGGFGVRLWRERSLRGPVGSLRFDDEEEDAPVTLELNGSTGQPISGLRIPLIR
jgi:hypothetical protein